METKHTKTEEDYRIEALIENEAKRRYPFSRVSGFKWTIGQCEEFRQVFTEGCCFMITKIQSLHKGQSNDLMDKGWNEAIEHITKNIL